MASKVSGVIEKIQTGGSNGTTYAIASTAYGYCETAANEPAKTVEMTGFKLEEGVTIRVQFQHENTTSSPTLNVQETGAKPITYGIVTKDNTDNIYGWNANDILTLTYDGTNWVSSNSAYATSAGSVSSGNIRPIKSKIFITKLYNSSSGDNYYQTVFNVIPDTYDAIWKIKYRLTFTVSGHNDYNAIYDCSMSGRSQGLYSFHCYNSLVTYPIYQHVLFRGSSLNYPHEVGFRIASSYGDTTVQKTVKVDIIEATNCTISLFDEIKSYKNTTITGYARSDINSTSNGLQETGDSDQYAYYVYSNGFRMTAGANKVLRYTLFGRLADGTYESFTITSNNTNPSKIKNPNGFLPDGKIYYNANGSDYVGITGATIYEQYHSIDYRYTFNISDTAIPASGQTYIVFTYDTSDSLLYLDDTWFTTTPNQTGKIYQRIGNNYYNQPDYRGSLLLNNPYYIYDGEDLQVWQPYAEKANTVPLSGVSSADDLKAIEALSGTSGLLKKTAANTWALDTSNYVTSSGITSVTIGATSPVQSSTSTAQTGSSASTTISLKDAYGDTKNPYGSKTKNYVLAAPSDANGAPSFRALVAADISDLSSTYLKLDGSNNMTADVNIIAGDTDKFINFWYNTNKKAGASWRIGELGSGAQDANYFVIQSGTSNSSDTTWTNALRIGMETHNVYIPSTTASTSITTGALTVAGGVGVAGQITAETLKSGNITIGGTTDTNAGKTFSSNSTLYINRGSQCSIIFQEQGINKLSIDTNNNFVPATTDTLSIGTSNKKWNAMYATTFYGNLNGTFNGYQIVSSINSPQVWYKYTMTYTTSTVPTTDWYVKIILNRSYEYSLTPILITADYSNVRGSLYWDLDSYNNLWRAYLTTYNGSNIKAIGRKYENSKNNLYIQFAAPAQYGSSVPQGTFTIYSPVEIVSIEQLNTAPSDLQTLYKGYNSNTDIKAENLYGTVALSNLTKGDTNTVLMGKGSSAAPAYVSVSPSISITAGTADNAPKVNLTVLGVSGTTAQELTKATTGVYGATKLYDGVDSASTTLAATANAVKTAYDRANAIVAAADAMVFKGTLDGATSTTYTPAADRGYTYKVAVAGLINGEPVEVGDILICTTDSTAAATSSNVNTVKANWVIIQNNVDGAVFKSSNTFTNGYLLAADGQNGKVKTINSLSGPFRVYTGADATKAFKISRGNGDGESVSHWVDDATYHIDYTNDEYASAVKLRIINTDTEGSDGSRATDYTYTFDHQGNFSGNAATATTATSLANNPSIQASTSNTNQVTITAGGKTSGAYTIPYATSAGSATSATTATYIKCTDTRNTALNPIDLNATQGIRFDFKAKSIINLTATDNFAGVMSFRPYASGSDWSGGNAHQIAFNSEGLHWRNGGTSWGNWYQILDSSNTSAANTNGAVVSVARNTDTKIATINGVDIKIKIPASDNTWRPIGTGADDAAAGNHTHTLSIAEDSGTNALTLVYGKKYKLTAGGSTYIFTMPASDNTNTATAADNILDGSNSETEITYAPYTTQQSKLSFDTSLTNPTRTDRLNLNGYFYATKHFSSLTPSSWIDGQRYQNGALNITDYSNTGSYNPWIRATNTWASGEESAKVGYWFSFGTLGTSFYLMGSASTRTENSYDHTLRYSISSGKLFCDSTEVSLSGHTHNYAGSSSAGGAATSANALNFVHTNEILIGNTNAQSGIHINHRRVSGGATSGNTAITDYYFKNGNGAITGVTIHATTFNGNATSATSAGKWTTACTLTIGNTGKSVDGSGNVSWTVAEIGASVVKTSNFTISSAAGSTDGTGYISDSTLTDNCSVIQIAVDKSSLPDLQGPISWNKAEVEGDKRINLTAKVTSEQSISGRIYYMI